MGLGAAVIVVAVPHARARAVRALARSRRARVRSLPLGVARENLHELAPRSAPQRHALGAAEQILQLLQRQTPAHRVHQRVRRALRLCKREHGVVVPLLVEPFRRPGAVRPRRAGSVLGPLVRTQSVGIPRRREGFVLRSFGKQGRVVSPRGRFGEPTGLGAHLGPEALAASRGDRRLLSEGSSRGGDVDFVFSRGVAVHGRGVRGPHAVEGEGRDHGAHVALLLTAHPRGGPAEARGPAPGELPEVERVPSADGIVAADVGLGSGVGAGRIVGLGPGAETGNRGGDLSGGRGRRMDGSDGLGRERGGPGRSGGTFEYPRETFGYREGARRPCREWLMPLTGMTRERSPRI